MDYRANERSKLSRDFVAAGDGLVAFGAALILSVQAHWQLTRVTVLQWICPGKSLAWMPPLDEKQKPQPDHP
jgi:hypothetical protein